MKKIMQICLSDARGGLEMCVVSTALDFHKRGYQSSCICLPGQFIEKELRASGAEIGIFPVEVRGRYFDFKASRAISKIIKQEKIDTVVMHLLREIWIVYPAIRKSPVRLVGICHMFIKNVNKKDFLHRILYGRFQHLIALGEAQKTELMRCLPFDPEKCSVIPNGIDTKLFSPNPSEHSRRLQLRSEWQAQDGEIVVGYVGRLDRKKGIAELISAIAIVKDKVKVKLVIVGDETVGEQGLKQELQDLVLKSGLQENVVMLPARRDIPEVMRSFDIFVMPSYEEAFGQVLIEAMASGLPCIATNAGGPIEILRGGEVGILVEPKSADSLASGLLRLAQDSNLRSTYSSLGRDVAVRNYDRQIVFQKLEAAITGA